MKGTDTMNTRRYPRTLEQAFGPYQRHGLVEQIDPMPKAERIVVAISLVGLAAQIALGLVAVRVTEGVVAVRDALGWRTVGTVVDYAQVARALGKI